MQKKEPENGFNRVPYVSFPFMNTYLQKGELDYGLEYIGILTQVMWKRQYVLRLIFMDAATDGGQGKYPEDANLHIERQGAKKEECVYR